MKGEALTATEHKKKRRHLFKRYLGRHIALGIALVLLIAYFSLRDKRAVADFVTTYITQPWYHFSSTAFGLFPFSLAEWLCALLVIGALIFIVNTIYKMLGSTNRWQLAHGAAVSLVAGALMFYALLCWLWGIGYYSYTFSELSGIEVEEVSVQELKEVTLVFAERANDAGEDVTRDADGVYTCENQKILNESSKLYNNLPDELAFLEGGPAASPKPLMFSYIMSQMNFSGVFFPFTGEANVNTLAPDCFLPSTAAHELTHQRGVAREQDANFAAIVACMESESSDFNYSGALLAYVHLSNALRQVSYEDWEEVSAQVGENVRRDLAANNAYWAQFDSPVADVSEATYEEFLQNQGQELGMRSYGACVDLLVAYYGKRL